MADRKLKPQGKESKWARVMDRLPFYFLGVMLGCFMVGMILQGKRAF